MASAPTQTPPTVSSEELQKMVGFSDEEMQGLSFDQKLKLHEVKMQLEAKLQADAMQQKQADAEVAKKIQDELKAQEEKAKTEADRKVAEENKARTDGLVQTITDLNPQQIKKIADPNVRRGIVELQTALKAGKSEAKDFVAAFVEHPQYKSSVEALKWDEAAITKTFVADDAFEKALNVIGEKTTSRMFSNKPRGQAIGETMTAIEDIARVSGNMNSPLFKLAAHYRNTSRIAKTIGAISGRNLDIDDMIAQVLSPATHGQIGEALSKKGEELKTMLGALHPKLSEGLDTVTKVLEPIQKQLMDKGQQVMNAVKPGGPSRG
ncbi:MAG TPA: hypothetical protein VFT64_06205 [Rickettsiales bacterium]|nr:hypothetical protein [Rickettsiales bacterium]